MAANFVIKSNNGSTTLASFVSGVNYSIVSTGVKNTSTGTFVYTYSGTNNFLGLASSSGATSAQLSIGSSIPAAISLINDTPLYIVESTPEITFEYTLTDNTTGTQTFQGNNNLGDCCDYIIGNGLVLKSCSLSGSATGSTFSQTYYMGIFEFQNTLESIDLSNLDTSAVTDMSYMFHYCSSITKIDVSTFNLSNCESTQAMFQDCTNLKTIICPNDWSQYNIDYSDYMFSSCTSLVGAISYNSSKVNINYANPTTGYFVATEPTGYDIYMNGTQLEHIYFNGTEINSLYFNGIQIL